MVPRTRRLLNRPVCCGFHRNRGCKKHLRERRGTREGQCIGGTRHCVRRHRGVLPMVGACRFGWQRKLVHVLRVLVEHDTYSGFGVHSFNCRGPPEWLGCWQGEPLREELVERNHSRLRALVWTRFDPTRMSSFSLAVSSRRPRAVLIRQGNCAVKVWVPHSRSPSSSHMG